MLSKMSSSGEEYSGEPGLRPYATFNIDVNNYLFGGVDMNENIKAEDTPKELFQRILVSQNCQQ